MQKIAMASVYRVDPRRLRRGLVDNGYLELPVTYRHVLSLKGLHRFITTRSIGCSSRDRTRKA